MNYFFIIVKELTTYSMYTYMLIVVYADFNVYSSYLKYVRIARLRILVDQEANSLHIET